MNLKDVLARTAKLPKPEKTDSEPDDIGDLEAAVDELFKAESPRDKARAMKAIIELTK